ncbi:HlyD family secretion protein [Rhizobium sp. SSA_523]|uniref:HlyD family secretion protein n=1 Tax=Rhizobium sp. SSA_523 TaxID=2952477 RepID=UPI0020919CB3|nr:HlyD family secretion protein [Rhizobium sp. SSA_523]MCO5731805.1 HlyD family secretion protein [Rhizobium sp. SSA_523]WKC25721.1 HlyD family secretion protein [Rhizobium sp. SSA_523]
MTVSSNSGSLRVVAKDEAPGADLDARTDVPVSEKPSAPAASGTDAKSAEPPAKKKKRSPILPVLLLAMLAGGGWYGYNWWTDGRFLISTDDAYVQGDIAVISPKVSGYVEKVNVVENQTVKAGDPLVTLDQGDYQIALEQAKANVESARLAVSRIDAQIAGGEASVKQSQAQLGALQAALRGAEITKKRAAELAAKSVGTTAELDNAQIALEQAQANLAAGEAAVTSAQANIELLKAQRNEAVNTIRLQELAVDQAERNLSFTILKAPYDGTIGNLSVQTGDLVSSGKRLASLVPLSDLYVDANFKETQIGQIVPGSKVRLHVDAFDGDTVMGTVQSIAPASGSVFSLLPPENATGNFTKVVQRVPVRIAIPREELERGHLRAGLSVVADVDMRTAPNRNAALAGR